MKQLYSVEKDAAKRLKFVKSTCMLSISGTLLAQKYPFQNLDLLIEERVNNIVSLSEISKRRTGCESTKCRT